MNTIGIGTGEVRGASAVTFYPLIFYLSNNYTILYVYAPISNFLAYALLYFILILYKTFRLNIS